MTGINLVDFDLPMSLLIVPPKQYVLNPVVSGTRLLLIQTLFYLEWATRTTGASFNPFSALLELNRRYNVGIVGFSSGMISACVVGTSATLLDFLSNATSAFRLALWIGVRAQCFRRQALINSGLRLNDDRSWCRILLGMGCHAAEEAISQFGLQGGESALLYVTAVNDEQCITVSGRPDILSSFIATLPEAVSILEPPVGTLYHSPTHNNGVRDEVLADLCRRKIRFPAYKDIVCPIRSTSTGKILEADQNVSLVQSIVDVILVQQVNWDRVTHSVAQSIPENEIAHLVNVGPGTGLLRSMENAFPDGGFVTHLVTFDDPRKTTILEPQDCVAIVGMAVNMPGAPNASKLWEILEKGMNTVVEVPANRFRIGDYTTRMSGRFMKARTGNFLDDVDKFDHEFFNISPREARSMDPQMRILLHTAYEALEDAGTGKGTLRAFLSGRISHSMGFGGPSVVVDTACSSSLVAIYQACRALVNGDCTAALAGGVNVITSPDMFLGLDRGHFLSPTGQCRVFDASANGYSRGEGCGLFVLKRLSDARVENDRILGVIRGVEVNQSGMARSITQPHVPTQIKLLQQLLERSGFAPEDVNVVEAHGTGTQTGDVGELESIRRVFSTNRSAENPLHVTSIKANIGHLEAASGAAGLAKLLLMLQHRKIPRLISLVNLNPRISELATDHTLIDTESRQWNLVREDFPRMALLNNFGAAGSNGALLLQEYVPPPAIQEGSISTAIPYIFGLSAKTETALVSMRMRMIRWLDSAHAQNARLSDIAYSLTARRRIYEHRLSLMAYTRHELVEALISGPSSVRISKNNGRAAFVFSGQGGQYVGMGREALQSGFPGVVQFIAPAENCSSLSELEQLEVAQSAIFALEYALAQLWISWGVIPAVVFGHSLGEYVAQTVAGVLSLRDALFLVASRARLMIQNCAPDSTGMMAVNISPVAIGSILKSSEEFYAITISCYNSPDDVVVSGPSAGLQALKAYLDGTDDFTLLARRVTISPPVIPIISNVCGKLVFPGDSSVFNAEYYVRHCTEPVLFDDGVRASVSTDLLPTIDAWIEIGPHAAVLPTLKRHPMVQKDTLFLTSMRKRQHPLVSLHNALSQLYLSPFEIKWRNVFSHLPFVSNISLPTYPWSNTSFWVSFEEEISPMYRINPLTRATVGNHGFPFTVLHPWIQFPFSGDNILSVFETPITHLSEFICGHRVREHPLCPASTYQELALAGVQASVIFCHTKYKYRLAVLYDIEFQSPLIYSEGTCYAIQTSIKFETEDAGSWKGRTHAHGNFKLQLPSSTSSKFSLIRPVISHRVSSITTERDSKIFSASSVYQVFFPRVVEYGKNYRAIRLLTMSAEGTEGYATVQLPANSDHACFVVNPILMDAMLHVAGFIANMRGNTNDVFICSKVGCVEMIPRLIDDSAPYGIYVNCAWLPGGDMLAETYTLEQGPANQIVAHLEGIHFRKVPLTTLEHGLTLAAGLILSEPLKLEGNVISSRSPTPPISQHFAEIQLGTTHSKSSALSSTKSPSGITINPSGSLYSANLNFLSLSRDVNKEATVKNILGVPCRSSEVSLATNALVKQPSDSGDKTCRSDSHFSLSLPSDLFATHTSAKAIQSFITSRLRASCESPNGSTHSCLADTMDGNAGLSLSALHLDTVPVPVQRTRSSGRAPLFLIHDGGGLVKYIHNIPSLGRDLWGIDNPYFITSQPWEVCRIYGFRVRQVHNGSRGTKGLSFLAVGTYFLLKLIANLLYVAGWSFGGIIAFEVARHLLKLDVVVKGVVLIDSPSPLNHVPLSDALVDSIVKLNRHSVPGISLLVKRQFQMNSRILLDYDPREGGGPYPRLVFLSSCENYNPGSGLEVPSWLSSSADRRSAAAEWEAIAGNLIKCIDIPGHHFQVFHSPFRTYLFGFPHNAVGC
ncbi:putative polyketide synthase [Russula earlei]|uniref:Polyketide synthase n=1 Tax=Russula earlei TaxID=71964 RepID=A0ACC0UBL2_9AGAM|nr:putative polyketide synthase [Russula earlei]